MVSRYDILLLVGVLAAGTVIYKIYLQSNTISLSIGQPRIKNKRTQLYMKHAKAGENLTIVKERFASHLQNLKRSKSQQKPPEPSRSDLKPLKPSKSHLEPSNPSGSRQKPSIPSKSQQKPSKPSKSHQKTSNPSTSRQNPSNPSKSRQKPSNPSTSRQNPSSPSKSRQKPPKPTTSHVKPSKPHVSLAIGILSKLSKIERRRAIRDTWQKVCLDKSSQVLCVFFTDDIHQDMPNKQVFMNEKKRYNDLEYMPFKGGFNFALRLVWMLKYFTNNYEFDYFLRVDDDYFICLDRLLKELPYRPKTGMYWGWIHCQPGIVRVDEGFMIWSKDVVLEILGKVNTTLMCHSFGDQAAALWMTQSKIKLTYFMDNARLMHEVTSYQGGKYLVPDLCDKYLALHGTYPVYMRKYWNLYTVDGTDKMIYDRKYAVPPIVPFKRLCGLSTAFNFNAFGAPYHAVPKPCKDNPVFVDPRREFPSRERG